MHFFAAKAQRAAPAPTDFVGSKSKSARRSQGSKPKIPAPSGGPQGLRLCG